MIKLSPTVGSDINRAMKADWGNCEHCFHRLFKLGQKPAIVQTMCCWCGKYENEQIQDLEGIGHGSYLGVAKRTKLSSFCDDEEYGGKLAEILLAENITDERWASLSPSDIIKMILRARDALIAQVAALTGEGNNAK